MGLVEDIKKIRGASPATRIMPETAHPLVFAYMTDPENRPLIAAANERGFKDTNNALDEVNRKNLCGAGKSKDADLHACCF